MSREPRDWETLKEKGPSMPQKFYAHSLPDRPPEEWQPLDEHLRNVAEMAREFAKPFGGGDWAYMAGLWHDLGKYSCKFQNRLLAMNDPEAHIEAKPGRPDHSTAGAQHVSSIFKEMGKLIAYAIAGHHAGLPDGKTNDGSCLVDADFLDTEKFLEPEKSAWRKGYPSLEVLERNLQCYMDDLVRGAPPTKVNLARKVRIWDVVSE